jgi:hypothetical protein
LSVPLFFLVRIDRDERTRMNFEYLLPAQLRQIIADHVERNSDGPIPAVSVTLAEETFGLANQLVFRERAGATPAGPESSSPAG